MLSKKTKSGHYYGVSINCEKENVLLQITDEDSQSRIRLTENEVDLLIKDLQRFKVQIVKD